MIWAKPTIEISAGGRVLIVEDDPGRISSFRSNLFGCTVLYTEDPDRAIELIERYNFRGQLEYSAIFLDHDLGSPEADKPVTSIPVAKYIRNHTDGSFQKNIVIHSFNPVGAKNLKNILPDATELPFGTFNIRVIE